MVSISFGKIINNLKILTIPGWIRSRLGREEGYGGRGGGGNRVTFLILGKGTFKKTKSGNPVFPFFFFF